MKKINYIDLFSGCGGLTDGFETTGKYNILAAVEWEKRPLETLALRLNKKHKIADAKSKCLNFDIQRTDELFDGWKDDEKYEKNDGMKNLIGDKKVHFIIGGPPCQAYSVAGRIRDKNGMGNDYRNYLFESYIKVVDRLNPDIIVFENVPGILSAKPNGINIIEKIKAEFSTHGYEILNNLNNAIVDMSDYGVPQIRKRIIIIGINRNIIKTDIQNVLLDFYRNILSRYKTKKISVKDAIGNMPKIYSKNTNTPCEKTIYVSAVNNLNNLKDHNPRYHSVRDMEIFKKLAYDKEKQLHHYDTTDDIKKLYTEVTGKLSNIHKYHVLDWNSPSTTIVSHLHKDGLRHIHPDPEQARTITVREAARLQSFDDEFEFSGTQGDKFKMIGNAVPPEFSNKLAKALLDFYEKYFK